MKVLMLGGSGFIGSHLTRELVLAGHDVVIADRHAPLISVAPGVEQIRCDLLEPGVVDHLVFETDCDMVVHLAAQVGRLFGEDDIRHTVQSNATLSAIVANSCGKRGVRLLYVSTSEVYGDQGEAICTEGGLINVPHNLYGLSKFWGEQVAAMYLDGRAPLQVIRLSMPFGPGMVPGRGRAAIVNMLWQANTGQQIPVHRGSERAWCWVGDTVHGIHLVIEHGEQAKEAWQWKMGHGVYNVGRSDNAIPMTEVARMAAEIVTERGGPLPADPFQLIEEVDPPAMQTVVKRLSNAKLQQLGWRPLVEVREGMEMVFEHVRRFDRDGNLMQPGAEKSKAVSALAE